MSIKLDLPSLDKVVEVVADGIDDFRLSDEERMEMQLKAEGMRYEHALRDKGMDNELLLGQMAINKQEAKHADWRVAGWRAGIGWACAATIWIYYPVSYLLQLIWYLFGWITEKPTMNIAEILGLAGTLLGSSVIRTVEKGMGIDTKGISFPVLPEINIRKKSDKIKLKSNKRG